MEVDYAAMGSRVRRLRLAQHMTQEQLAEACNISFSFLGHIERGTRKMSLETLAAVSRTLHVPADELLFGPSGAAARALPRLLEGLSFRDAAQEERFRAAVLALVRGMDAF